MGGKYIKALRLKNRNPKNVKVIYFKQACKDLFVTKYEKIELFYLA